jgi:hypothetical protein
MSSDLAAEVVALICDFVGYAQTKQELEQLSQKQIQ